MIKIENKFGHEVELYNHIMENPYNKNIEKIVIELKQEYKKTLFYHVGNVAVNYSFVPNQIRTLDYKVMVTSDFTAVAWPGFKTLFLDREWSYNKTKDEIAFKLGLSTEFSD